MKQTIKCSNCNEFKAPYDFSQLTTEGCEKNLCIDCDHEANGADTEEWSFSEQLSKWILKGDDNEAF